MKIKDKDGKPIRVDGSDDIPDDTVVAFNPETGEQWNDITDANQIGICFFKDLRDQSKYDKELWKKLMQVGLKLESNTKNLEHELPAPFVETILGTLSIYGADGKIIDRMIHDLTVAKYRIFDWLGMCLTGRLEVDPSHGAYQCIESMVKLYIAQSHVGGWAWWLRGHDMLAQEPSHCQDCIDSYEDWMKEQLT